MADSRNRPPGYNAEYARRWRLHRRLERLEHEAAVLRAQLAGFTFRQGKGTPRCVIAPDGRVFTTIAEAAEDAGVSPAAMRYRAQKSLYGWRFADRREGSQ